MTTPPSPSGRRRVPLWRQRPWQIGATVVAVVVLGGAVLALTLGGGGDDDGTVLAGSTSTTSAGDEAPIAPLTGVPDASGGSRTRPALTVKIDNIEDGRPQFGLEQADVVYEEVVEGGYTRLAAIFQSQVPEQIGPVRSVRKTDQSIVWPIGGIFAYSGGAPYAIESIDTAPVTQVDETRAGDAMFRDDSRPRPYNLYGRGPALFAKGGEPVPPPPLFVYREKGDEIGGRAVRSFHVGFAGRFAADYTWDPNSRSWARTALGGPHTTASGARVAPRNVVVMRVEYAGGDAAGVGAEAQMVGEGDVIVYTAGRWVRPDKAKPARLLDASGRTIALTPGPTWVELPETGYAVTSQPAPTTPSTAG